MNAVSTDRVGKVTAGVQAGAELAQLSNSPDLVIQAAKATLNLGHAISLENAEGIVKLVQENPHHAVRMGLALSYSSGPLRARSDKSVNIMIRQTLRGLGDGINPDTVFGALDLAATHFTTVQLALQRSTRVGIVAQDAILQSVSQYSERLLSFKQAQQVLAETGNIERMTEALEALEDYGRFLEDKINRKKPYQMAFLLRRAYEKGNGSVLQGIGAMNREMERDGYDKES